MQHLIRVHAEPPGQFTAEAVGIPDLRATADSQEEAVQRVRALLAKWLATGQLVPIEVAEENPLGKWFGHARNDPDFELYQEEIRRFRQELDHPSPLSDVSQECPP